MVRSQVSHGAQTEPAAERVRPLQPLLHDLLVTLCGPTVLLSAPDGEVRSEPGDASSPTQQTAQGLFHADRRALSLLSLSVGGHALEVVQASALGPGRSAVVGLARCLDDAIDPLVRVVRRRRLTVGILVEDVELRSSRHPATATVVLHVGGDLAPIDAVKRGAGAAAPLPAVVDGSTGRWSASGTEVRVSAPDAHVTALSAGGARLAWQVDLAPGQTARLRWQVTVTDAPGVVRAAPADPPWERPAPPGDPRLRRLQEQALDDLDALRVTVPPRAGAGVSGAGQSTAGDEVPDQVLAAGAPWFLTLFGRDSIWAARLLLPLSLELAAGTLRALARWQGRHDVIDTAEEPGKVLHELRRGPLRLDDAGRHLPPAYYGTVDATPLWVCLLHDAWRAGLARERVAALLPAAQAALAWVERTAERSGGLLSYHDASGHGLTNQGWKDSGDSVRFADGNVATGPVALVEVQAYAHEAALAGAALLDAFGLPGGEHWRGWAAALSERVRQRFWVSDAAGALLAMALDGAGRPVDALTSNIGHLLGTGMLTRVEEDVVVTRLLAPEMADGFGLRTMSRLAGGYAPSSYHCGSIWPHDTAIVLHGLHRTGRTGAGRALAEGLLEASDAFDGRLPELWCGDPRAEVRRPVPYPAACRPQAWSAAASLVVAQVLQA